MRQIPKQIKMILYGWKNGKGEGRDNDEIKTSFV
jgi:hypothetical protein